LIVLDKHRRHISQALAVLAAGAFFWLLFFVSHPRPQVHSLQGSTMGTTWQVQVVATEAQIAQEAGAAIKALLQHLDRAVFSTWSAESELTRLNHSEPLVAHSASPEMLDVLLLAQTIYARSRHTFDVSVGPLVNLWGFGPEPVDGVPDAAAIAQARAGLGLEALHIDRAARTVTFERPLTLDLSGIAKGYAVDAVAGLLQELGFESFLVEIGGELRLQGRRPDDENWTVAVERPQSGMPDVYTRIDTRGEALGLAGSGDYRNYREVNGRRYSHEIDPRTGAPVTHTLASVTVISDTAAAADAWATALMVLGPEEGRAVADSEGLAAYFIMRAPDGFEQAYTAAFARYLQQTAPEVPD
jgi:thiamine biosynthesis lipoprotein